MIPMLPMFVPEIFRIESAYDQERDDEANVCKFVCKLGGIGGDEWLIDWLREGGKRTRSTFSARALEL